MNTTTSATPGHALYRFYGNSVDGKAGPLLYVGLTCDPGARWVAHSKDKPWWHEVASVKVEHFDTREEVAAAERAAIETEKPVHNLTYASTEAADEARELLQAVATEHSKLQAAAAAARQQMREAVVNASTAGVSEVQIADLSGVTRMTVRKWLGK